MKTHLLRITSSYFVAGLVWTLTPSGWRATDAAPIVHWMLRLSAQQVKDELVRRGWTWEWVDESRSG